MKAIVRDFLSRLLPWKGTEETTWKSIWIRGPAQKDPNKMISWGHATQDLDELVEIALFYAKKPGREVYFGLGSQRVSKASEHGGKWQASIRTTNNMVSYKAIWLDLDCGPDKGYKTQADALQAVGEFCDIAELPRPNQVVNSGNGLHVYWVVDIPLPYAMWSEFANALDAATKKHGLPCDSQCTIDGARILRVPGTNNWKGGQPKPVEMGQPGPEYSHAFLAAALNQYMGPQPYKGPRAQAAEYDELTKRFMEGLAPTHSEPVDLIEIADMGCGVLGEAFDSAGKDHKQPLWHLLMLAAAFDKDPRGAAHMLSDGYAGYDAAEVEEMLARKQNERKVKNLGWPSCFSFSKLSPLCQSCKFFADNKSPMHIPLLQRSSQTDDDLPGGYVRDAMGFVCTEWALHVKDEKQLTPVLMNQMYDAALLADTEDLVFKTKIGKEERNIVVTLDQLGSLEKTISSLTHQSLMTFKKAHAQLIRSFLMAWVHKLHQMRLPKVRADVYGWGLDRTVFTYGGMTYGAGAPNRALLRDTSPFTEYQPCGKLDIWQALAKALTDTKRPCMDAILATSFGAPLVPFTGMYGLLFSALSLESGIGKSTALRIGQAVWGSPKATMNMLKDTTNSMFRKLGEIQSLPVMWDELKVHKDIEEFATTLFHLTQGREKSRLDREAKMRKTATFSTLVSCTTNESIAEAMGRAAGSSEAGANRIFEIDVAGWPPGTKGLSTDWDVMLESLDHNYGRAGEIYAAWLARSTDYVSDVVREVRAYFETTLNSTPDERFWLATMAVVYSGATFANQLNLTSIDLPALEKFLVEQFDRQRSTRKETVTRIDTYDDALAMAHRLIAATRQRNMLVTDYVQAVGPGRPRKNELHGAIDKLEHIWVQLGLQDDTLRFNRNEFNNWTQRMKLPTGAIYTAFRQHLNGQPVFATIGVGVDHPIVKGIFEKTQTYLFEITLPSVITQQTAAPGPANVTTVASLPHSSSPAVPPGSP